MNIRTRLTLNPSYFGSGNKNKNTKEDEVDFNRLAAEQSHAREFFSNNDHRVVGKEKDKSLSGRGTKGGQHIEITDEEWQELEASYHVRQTEKTKRERGNLDTQA